MTISADVEFATEQQYDAVAAVLSERDYQDDKWGGDHMHDVGGYLTLLRIALRKAEDAYGASKEDLSLDYMRKIAALAIACMEQNGSVERSVWHMSGVIPDQQSVKDTISTMMDQMALMNPFFTTTK